MTSKLTYTAHMMFPFCGLLPGRIIYHFTPDSSESEEILYTASMNDTVMKFVKNQAALSSLYI